MYRKDLEQKFKNLYLDPEHCEPLVQVRVWGPRKYSIAEQLAGMQESYFGGYRRRAFSENSNYEGRNE